MKEDDNSGGGSDKELGIERYNVTANIKSLLEKEVYGEL